MAFLTQEEMRRRARQRAARDRMAVEDILKEASKHHSNDYDIFLSQTIRDAELVLGVYDQLTALGFRVFCDWIDSPEIDRSNVTPANADYLRRIMQRSKSLLYLDTNGAEQSLWMCWELGWFDGHEGHVAILPVLSEGSTAYRGREFLGLYPYVEIDGEGRLKIVRPSATNSRGLTLIEAPNSTTFEGWMRRGEAFMRPRNIESWGVMHRD
ncbi:hypothetical protein [Granulicella sp. dw_53]|uniref:hypothetical protein n=1 Tax=Granulicella sp. dw_53 TaxID=2719792 RepID=UPI001BD233DC|nr:hypothetical protein [Granulicella sp. dw_53]